MIVFMNKKYFNITIIAIVILAVICICLLFLNNESKITSFKDVKFSIEKDTLTPSQATFIIENKSTQEISFGEEYFLEKRSKNKWHELDTINDLFVNQPLYKLKTNEQFSKKLNWEYAYGKLPKGTYRLVKEIQVNKKAKYIIAEFTI